jgi:hypothetical protein
MFTFRLPVSGEGQQPVKFEEGIVIGLRSQVSGFPSPTTGESIEDFMEKVFF